VLSIAILYKMASRDILRRQLAEQGLQESEERYRKLYNYTPGMLHAVDPNGRIISVSDHWLKTFGYSRDEVIGKRLSAFLTEDSQRRLDEDGTAELRDKGCLSDMSCQFLKKNGSTIDVLLSEIADRDDFGRVRRFMAVLVDVTQQRRLEAELKVLRERQ